MMRRPVYCSKAGGTPPLHITTLEGPAPLWQGQWQCSFILPIHRIMELRIISGCAWHGAMEIEDISELGALTIE